jgi:SAM-dependent methyltransferase
MDAERQKAQAAEFWNQMFGAAEYRYGTTPNAFLAGALPGLLVSPSDVLCVGDGEGRNGAWCAARGHRVTSLDPSSAGLAKARKLALELGVELTTIEDGMPSSTILPATFDAVVLCYVHLGPTLRPAVHAACVEALRPGGVIVLEAFTPAQIANRRQSGGPASADMMFTATMLASDFGDLEILVLEEVETQLHEGPGHSGIADVVRLIARRR